jgi:hypothetical protein
MLQESSLPVQDDPASDCGREIYTDPYHMRKSSSEDASVSLLGTEGFGQLNWFIPFM